MENTCYIKMLREADLKVTPKRKAVRWRFIDGEYMLHKNVKRG